MGATLERRFNWAGEIEDLDGAIAAHENAVRLVPGQPSAKSKFLNHLSIILSSRYDHSGLLADLNRIIDIAKEGVDLTTKSNWRRVSWLSTLGQFLRARFVRTGAIDDLDEAFAALEEGLQCSQQDKAFIEGLLGTLLIARFDYFGSTEDLINGVDSLEDAMKSMPMEHQGRGILINSLVRARQMVFVDDDLGIDNSPPVLVTDRLSEDIETIDQILSSTPTGNSLFASLLHNRSTALLKRSLATGSTDDLFKALEDIQKGIECTSPSSPDLARWFNNRSIALRVRSRRTESVDDLNAAIADLMQSLELSQSPNRNRARYLTNLGSTLEKRAKQAMSDNMTGAIAAYEEVVYESSSPPVLRLEAANKSVELLGSSDMLRSGRILRTAVGLLPSVNIRALDSPDRDVNLALFTRLINTAVSHWIQLGESKLEALRLLELGRGFIASLQLDIRTDISCLEDKHSELAQEFKQLRNELNRPLHANITSTQRATGPKNWRFTAAKRFESLITKIRLLNGFERFLLGPSDEELKALAEFGPIVVFNVATTRSNVFLITTQEIRCLHLPNLSLSDLEKHAKSVLDMVSNLRLSNYYRSNKKLLRILEWLWVVAVEPVLDALGFTSSPNGDNWPHVWWVASGWLNLLPIHAAGRYAEKTTANALDRLVSSYTPTMRGLAFARENAEKIKNRKNTPESLFIRMSQTEGQENLPGAADEVARIVNVLPESMSMHILVTPTKAEVEALLKTCQIVHFACHGESSNFLPSLMSILKLEDWEDNEFSIGAILQLRFEHPHFAYLSACQTAMIQDKGVLDESIHLAGAFQLAGFPHVIATLWDVDDTSSIQVAEEVYSTMHMASSTKTIEVAVAARGLHNAVCRLRDKEVQQQGFPRRQFRKEPLLWASYVHMGA